MTKVALNFLAVLIHARNSQIHLRIFFYRTQNPTQSNVVCNDCEKLNHLFNACVVKTNTNGLKVKWVPKTFSKILCSFECLKASTTLEQCI